MIEKTFNGRTLITGCGNRGNRAKASGAIAVGLKPGIFGGSAWSTFVANYPPEMVARYMEAERLWNATPTFKQSHEMLREIIARTI